MHRFHKSFDQFTEIENQNKRKIRKGKRRIEQMNDSVRVCLIVKRAVQKSKSNRILSIERHLQRHARNGVVDGRACQKCIVRVSDFWNIR